MTVVKLDDKQVEFCKPLAKDEVEFIIRYESGELEVTDMIRLFAWLIRTGRAWSLQGHYGRTANAFIDQGIIDSHGVVDFRALDFLLMDNQ